MSAKLQTTNGLWLTNSKSDSNIKLYSARKANMFGIIKGFILGTVVTLAITNPDQAKEYVGVALDYLGSFFGWASEQAGTMKEKI